MTLIKHQHVIDKIAFFNAILSGVALYPQIWHVLAIGSTEGISSVSFGLIFINSFVWFVYALHRDLISLSITSILNLVASGLLALLAMLGQ